MDVFGIGCLIHKGRFEYLITKYMQNYALCNDLDNYQTHIIKEILRNRSMVVKSALVIRSSDIHNIIIMTSSRMSVSILWLINNVNTVSDSIVPYRALLLFPRLPWRHNLANVRAQLLQSGRESVISKLPRLKSCEEYFWRKNLVMIMHK